MPYLKNYYTSKQKTLQSRFLGKPENSEMCVIINTLQNGKQIVKSFAISFLHPPHLLNNHFNFIICQDLLDWQKEDERQHRHLVHRNTTELSVTLDSHHPHKKCFGNSVTINDETVALFRIGEEVYATQAKCPHAGKGTLEVFFFNFMFNYA